MKEISFFKIFSINRALLAHVKRVFLGSDSAMEYIYSISSQISTLRACAMCFERSKRGIPLAKEKARHSGGLFL